MSETDIGAMYNEWIKWREAHPDSFYIVFDTSPRCTQPHKPMNRYIVVKGIEVYRFFGDVVILTMSGYDQLHNPICCFSGREASHKCEELNARYVHDNEPDLFAVSPSWQEAYEKYLSLSTKATHMLNG